MALELKVGLTALKAHASKSRNVLVYCMKLGSISVGNIKSLYECGKKMLAHRWMSGVYIVLWDEVCGVNTGIGEAMAHLEVFSKTQPYESERLDTTKKEIRKTRLHITSISSSSRQKKRAKKLNVFDQFDSSCLWCTAIKTYMKKRHRDPEQETGETTHLTT